MALARRLGDVKAEGRALHLLGGANLPSPAIAIEFLEQALTLHKTTDDWPWQAVTLNLLGLATLRNGDIAKGVTLLEEAAGVSVAHGEMWCRALALISLGSAMRATEAPARTIRVDRESLREALALGDGIVTSEALLGLGGVLATANRAADAVRFFGAAEAVRETVGLSLRHLMVPHVYERDLAAARQALAPDAFAAAWAAGRLIAPADLLEAAGEAVAAATGSPLAPHPDAPPEKLTPRELDVPRVVAEHRTDRREDLRPDPRPDYGCAPRHEHLR